LFYLLPPYQPLVLRLQGVFLLDEVLFAADNAGQWLKELAAIALCHPFSVKCLTLTFFTVGFPHRAVSFSRQVWQVDETTP